MENENQIGEQYVLVRLPDGSLLGSGKVVKREPHRNAPELLDNVTYINAQTRRQAETAVYKKSQGPDGVMVGSYGEICQALVSQADHFSRASAAYRAALVALRHISASHRPIGLIDPAETDFPI